MTVSVRALGLMCNDPQRAHLALVELSQFVVMPSDADAIGVASLVDGSTLLKRFPSVAAGSTLADLMGPAQGRCTVAQIRAVGELRPSGPTADAGGTENVGPFRARSYAAAVVGGPQTADAATSSRSALLAGVPDFLARFICGTSEAEAFFVSVLARLHKRGALDVPHANGALCASVLQEALNDATSSAQMAPRHVMFTNGVELIHASVGMPGAILSLRGLSEASAATVDATYVDSSMARERLRRFRGVLCLGALQTPLSPTTTAPQGGTLLQLPADGGALVTRELAIKPLAHA